MPKREKRVLVVDDNRDVLDLLSKIFEDSNIKSVLADDGESALKLIKTEDLMVMYIDITLPGMSGIDLVKKIRKDNPIAFIFAMTGHTEKFDVFDCRHFGFDDYFEKPFEAKEIIKSAKEAFRKLKRWEHE